MAVVAIFVVPVAVSVGLAAATAGSGHSDQDQHKSQLRYPMNPSPAYQCIAVSRTAVETQYLLVLGNGIAAPGPWPREPRPSSECRD